MGDFWFQEVGQATSWCHQIDHIVKFEQYLVISTQHACQEVHQQVLLSLELDTQLHLLDSHNTMAAQQQHQQQAWLRDLDFPQQDLQLLANHNIHNARDLLVQSPLDLIERLNIPLSQAQRILQHTAMQIAPPYITVSHDVCRLLILCSIAAVALLQGRLPPEMTTSMM